MTNTQHPALIRLVEKLKKLLHCRTYYIEYIFVTIILVAVALISKKGPVEWIGVLAVFFTFGHTQVSDRLQEAEAHRHKNLEKVTVECYYKLNRYFYLKEICWFLYFVLIGAWSALAGVIIFLLYPRWRKLWRKYHPL